MTILTSILACITLLLIVEETFTCPKDKCKVWNTQLEKCGECNAGFIGECCQLPCRYPSYGDKCQSWCNCEISNCSFVTGCDDGSPTVSPIVPSVSNSLLSVFATYTPSTGCPPGYIGSDCKIPCRYPNYGVYCQLQCECEEDMCHHGHGCKTYRYCSLTDRPRRAALLYSTVSLGVVAVILFTAYAYISSFCKFKVEINASEM